MVFNSSGEGKMECWAEFIMTKLGFLFFSFFRKLGVGLPVVYSRSHSESRLSLQLGASCVNQPLFICSILASIHFLLFHSSWKGVQRRICGWGISYTAANTHTRRSSAEGVEEQWRREGGEDGVCGRVEERRGDPGNHRYVCVLVGGWVAWREDSEKKWNWGLSCWFGVVELITFSRREHRWREGEVKQAANVNTNTTPSLHQLILVFSKTVCWSLICCTREERNGAMFVERRREAPDRVNYRDSSGHIFISELMQNLLISAQLIRASPAVATIIMFQWVLTARKLTFQPYSAECSLEFLRCSVCRAPALPVCWRAAAEPSCAPTSVISHSDCVATRDQHLILPFPQGENPSSEPSAPQLHFLSTVLTLLAHSISLQACLQETRVRDCVWDYTDSKSNISLINPINLICKV